MPTKVVVLGAGYAGTTAVTQLEKAGDEVDLTWISNRDYHLVRHEVHRAVRTPAVRDRIAIPIAEIRSPETRFVEGTVRGLDVDERRVELADGSTVAYDYVLVAIGGRTPYYGIPGMSDHAFTLESLPDALAIHEAIDAVGRTAGRNDPATVVVGGAGLSGVQCAGEVAAYRDEHEVALDVVLLEALPEILPGTDPALQSAVRKRVDAADVEVVVDDPIVAVDEDVIHLDVGAPQPYDVFVWTGGITGRTVLESATVENEHNRLTADATFRTSDDRVFAVGDAAVVAQNGTPAPPTAQAAWQAGAVAAENVRRAAAGEPLEPWHYVDRGTLVSIGDEAIAHDVGGLPFSTFGSLPAEFLKKFVAARWIADVTSWRRALKAWPYL